MKKLFYKSTVGLLLMGVFVLAVAVLEAPVAAQSEKGGAKLWAENCGRCHLIRSPKERSDREWEIIMQHMRTRAYLTGKESRRILEFLKSAN